MPVGFAPEASFFYFQRLYHIGNWKLGIGNYWRTVNYLK